MESVEELPCGSNPYDIGISEDDEDIQIDDFIEALPGKVSAKEALENVKSLKPELDNIEAKLDEEGRSLRSIFSHNNDIFSNDDARRLFLETISDDRHNILSPPISTMITITGELENVSIDDKNPGIFHCNDSIVAILSNYGEIVSEKYGHGKKEKKKTGRGRKKNDKDPGKKKRVMQGNGRHFQSQLTLVYMCRAIRDTTTVHGFKEYKFKIFREKKKPKSAQQPNDKPKSVIHIPGVTPETINEVLDGCQAVLDLINEVYHPGETDPEKLAQLSGLYPCTKNYKFYVKMNRGEIIDFIFLKKIFMVHKTEQIFHRCDEDKCRECDNEAILKKYIPDLEDIGLLDDDIPEHPEIFNVTYTGEENTTLFVEFSTPKIQTISELGDIQIQEDKKIRVNFYPGKEIPKTYGKDVEDGAYGGKINILGGHDEPITRQIYFYLNHIFETFSEYLIIKPEVNKVDEYIYEVWNPEDNIAQWESEQEMWEYSLNHM